MFGFVETLEVIQFHTTEEESVNVNNNEKSDKFEEFIIKINEIIEIEPTKPELLIEKRCPNCSEIKVGYEGWFEEAYKNHINFCKKSSKTLNTTGSVISKISENSKMGNLNFTKRQQISSVEKTTKCEYCDKVFSHYVNYSDHVKSCEIMYILPYSKFVEQIPKGFQCLICSLTMGTQRSEMYQHVKDEHFPNGRS